MVLYIDKYYFKLLWRYNNVNLRNPAFHSRYCDNGTN